MGIKELVGCIVSAVYINPEHTYIQFVTDKGIKSYDAYGDCCSHSWIENINNLASLLNGNPILVAEERKEDGMRDRTISDHPEHHCLKFYSYDIITNSGTTTIEFRNSSNGYYGGALCFTFNDTLNEDCFLLTKDF